MGIEPKLKAWEVCESKVLWQESTSVKPGKDLGKKSN